MTQDVSLSGLLPVHVGAWYMGGLVVPLTRRPRWFTRVMARWLLEWEWRDKA